jgi:hypothetical protein
MFDMIEVKEDAMKQTADVLGWQVSVSQLVWDRCVAVPRWVEGQSEQGRVRDLLAQLRFNLPILAAPRQNHQSVGLRFPVTVVNDNRGHGKRLDGIASAGEEVPIEALASFGKDGSPLLMVLAQSELTLFGIYCPR